MSPWNAQWRFPLYLRIWIAVIVAVGLLTFAFGWLWQQNRQQTPEREVLILNEADEVIGQSKVRPTRTPTRGLEFDVEMKDGRFAEVEGTEREIPADLVLLAMGFTGPQREGLVEQLGVELDERGNVTRDKTYASSVPGVYVAGDAGRGQSLIVWAIAEGRAAAAGVDAFLTGSTTLPVPIPPTERPLVV